MKNGIERDSLQGFLRDVDKRMVRQERRIGTGGAGGGVGPTGLQGIQGLQGLVGDTGPTGPIGPTGPSPPPLPVPFGKIRATASLSVTATNGGEYPLTFPGDLTLQAGVTARADRRGLVVPEAGVYLLLGHVRYQTSQTGRHDVYLLPVGTLTGAGGFYGVVSQYLQAGGIISTIEVSTTVVLAAGDDLGLTVVPRVAGALAIYGDGANQWTTLSALKVGATP